MLLRQTPAVSHCENRAAEAEQFAELAPDSGTKRRYRLLARAWRRLARNAEFTERLDAMLSDPGLYPAGRAFEKAQEYAERAEIAATAEERAECAKMRVHWLEIANSWQFLDRK